ncbi:MAG: Uncharacterised protein [Puniceicoccaceae bacterium MED-G32]|nr:MAG: Uncharacterised protein [Puniceicoccaceae bacterium MED-G32]
MLTRVSHNLFWLSRYIERVENLARIADTTFKDSIEIESSVKGSKSNNSIWEPVLNNLGYPSDTIESLIDEKDANAILSFINFSPDNGDSIANCISQARENARLVRDQISEEIWRELNRFHLLIRSSRNDEHWQQNPVDFYRKVIDLCMLLSGLINSTILHDEGWNFLQTGKHIERAEKTLRILTLFAEKGENHSRSINSTLRSATAYSAYLSATKGSFKPESIYQFLLFAPSFPRSVRYCCRQLNYFLHQISGCPINSFSNPVEENTRNIVAKLDFYNTQNSDKTQLKAYLEPLLEDLDTISNQIFDENNYAMPKFQKPWNSDSSQQTQSQQ